MKPLPPMSSTNVQRTGGGQRRAVRQGASRPRKATDDLNGVYSLYSPLQTTLTCALLEGIHRRSVKQPLCFTDWLCLSPSVNTGPPRSATATSSSSATHCSLIILLNEVSSSLIRVCFGSEVTFSVDSKTKSDQHRVCFFGRRHTDVEHYLKLLSESLLQAP